ncbi:hypothetical protein [Streptomyces sp. NPDC001380]|uniref:hypothetical protein n=1 Tax=Streptomyces sp. NPDC001380 TaxID=3364566 RepID=UPI0036C05FE3
MSGHPARPAARPDAAPLVWHAAAATVREAAREAREAARSPALAAAGAVCPAEAERVGRLLRQALDDGRDGLAVLADGLLLDAVRLGRAARSGPSASGGVR